MQMVQSNTTKVKNKLSVYKTSIALKKSLSNSRNISPMKTSKIKCTRSLPSLVPVNRIEELQIDLDINKIDPYSSYYSKKSNIMKEKFELPKIDEDSEMNNSSNSSSISPNSSTSKSTISTTKIKTKTSSSNSYLKSKKNIRNTLNDYLNNTKRKAKIEYNLTREDIPYLSNTPLPKIVTEIHQKLPLNIRDVVKFESKEDKITHKPEYSPMSSPNRKSHLKYF